MTPFCPTCLIDETRPGSTCGDCGEKLVDKGAFLKTVDRNKLRTERLEWETRDPELTGGEAGRKRHIARINVVLSQAEDIQVDEKKRKRKLMIVLAVCIIVTIASILKNWSDSRSASKQVAPKAPVAADE